MSKAEIILIDDDVDDCEIIEETFAKINIQHPLHIFNEADTAFDYLKLVTRQPYLIVCDINMPGINGLEFKDLINKHNNQRLIATPFIFLTTASDPTTIRFANSLNIQGYYEKPTSMKELENLFLNVVNYWDHKNRQSNMDITPLRDLFSAKIA